MAKKSDFLHTIGNIFDLDKYFQFFLIFIFTSKFAKKIKN